MHRWGSHALSRVEPASNPVCRPARRREHGRVDRPWSVTAAGNARVEPGDIRAWDYADELGTG